MKNTRITSLAVLSLALGAALAFPLAMVIENNTYRMAVEPETGTELQPYAIGEKAVPVVIKDDGHLNRVLSNIEQLNHLGGWIEDAGMHLVLLGEVESTPVANPFAQLLAATSEQQAAAEAATATAEADAAAATAAAQAQADSDAAAQAAAAAAAAEADAAAVKPAAASKRAGK